MAKYVKQKCVHCLQYHEELTEDHIFPKNWYPDSTPSDIEKWTAPACEPCNNKLGAAEEELFNRLIICVDENDLAASGIVSKVLKRLSYTSNDKRKLGRQIKFLIDTVKNSIPYLYEEGNIHVLKGGTPKEGVRGRQMIRIPTDKLLIVGEKIVRGLEFKLRGRLIEDDRELIVITPHAHNKAELELVDNWNKLILPIEENACRGPGFVVRYGVNPIDNDWVIYHIKIWNHLEIWAIIRSMDKKVKGLNKNLGESNKYVNKALELVRQNKIDDALNFVNLAIELKPDNFTAYQTKADILNKLERYEESLEAINNAIKINPNNFLAIKNKVSLLGMFDRHDEAIAFADRALQLKQDDHFLWHMKGVSLYYIKKYQESILVLDKALKLNPGFFLSVIKKIHALTCIGKFKEVIELFESSNLPEGDYNNLLNNIGYVCLQINQYEKAKKYLDEAVVVGEKHKEIYYNLCWLNFKLKNYRKFLFFYFKFRFLLYKEKILKIISKITPKRDETNRQINRLQKLHGPGRLFSSNPQERELKAILKIFHSPLWASLCNDTFKWFAVNIPLDLLGDNGYKGDIDLLVSMPKDFPPNEKTESRYRSMEVKSILVGKNGKVKSLGKGKHNKLLGQLKKLKNFGCEQIFLLEIYATERGYSSDNYFLPKDIIDEADKKKQLLQNNGFGYVLMVDEPSPDYDDENGGMFHMPINILPTIKNQISSPFLDLVNRLDNFYAKKSKEPSEFPDPKAITYCKRCKQLFMIQVMRKSFPDLKCPNCNKNISI